MKISFNVLFQIFALIAQAGNWLLPAIPLEFHAGAALVIALTQCLVSWRAHYFNPDGTHASKPYDETGNGMILPRKNGGDNGFLE